MTRSQSAAAGDNLRLFLRAYVAPGGLPMAGLVLMAGNSAWADRGEAKNDRAVRLLTTVPIPGTAANTTGGRMVVFDISWVDQASRTYYLADRSNADSGQKLQSI